MMRITRVNAIHTTEVQHIEAEWEHIAQVIGTSVECENDALRRIAPLFTGWRLKEKDAVLKTYSNGHSHYSRCKENCVALYALTLDIDNDPEKGAPYQTIEEAARSLDGLEALLYPSYNHLNPEKHGGVDKFRVVIPLQKPISYQKYLKIYNSLASIFPSAARESWTPSQPFWPAMHHPDREELARTILLHGELMDISTLPESDARPPSLAPSESIFLATENAKNSTIMAVKNKETHTVAEWFNLIQPGYEHRVPCYSAIREEQNPTAFFYKEGETIVHYDGGQRKQHVIQIVLRDMKDIIAAMKNRSKHA